MSDYSEMKLARTLGRAWQKLSYKATRGTIVRALIGSKIMNLDVLIGLLFAFKPGRVGVCTPELGQVSMSIPDCLELSQPYVCQKPNVVHHQFAKSKCSSKNQCFRPGYGERIDDNRYFKVCLMERQVAYCARNHLYAKRTALWLNCTV
jgi:hypothetical protein